MTEIKRKQNDGGETEWKGRLASRRKNKLRLNKVAMVLEENTLRISKLNDKKIKT